jgi:hypothetical protein
MGYDSALTIKTAICEITELRNFVGKFAETVESGKIDCIKNYSFAFIRFKEKKFEKCLEHLSRKDSLGQNFVNKKYRLQICCLYELANFDDALRVIDSFEHHLRKNKIVSEVVRVENLKFIKGIKKLIKMNLGNFYEADIDIMNIMDLTRNSVFGYWFEEKAEELESFINRR